MMMEGKIQKWGNSSALRLPATLLAAAGIPANSEVDIEPRDGKLVIQLKERTQEASLDQLFESEPGAAELIAMVKASLNDAISNTEATTQRCNDLIDKLDNGELG